MDIGELVAIALDGVQDKLKTECQFKLDVESVDNEEDESIPFDDKDSASVESEQANNGGVLGENLTSGSQGKDGTVLNPPPKAEPDHRKDKHAGFMLSVAEAGNIDGGNFPITCGAHHLIPGNASLKESTLKPYITKGKTVKATYGDKTYSWKVKEYVGYNVNGAHNGVWLPASYAIRSGSEPLRKTWSAVRQTNKDWCVNYMAAGIKSIGGQFHDTHVGYSNSVKKALNKIAFALAAHQKQCSICRDSLKEIAPPYLVKTRLYNMSIFLKNKVTGHPYSWKDPFFTSDKWIDEVFDDDGELNPEFMAIYDNPQNTRITLL